MNPNTNGPAQELDTEAATLHPATHDELWNALGGRHPHLEQARHLGEALVGSGIISVATLQAALQEQQRRNQHGDKVPLGQLLVGNHIITDAQLHGVISAWLGEKAVDPRYLPVDASALCLVPHHVAERESVLPLLLRDDALVVLMADPWDHRQLEELRFLTQKRIIGVPAAPGTLMPAIDRYYRRAAPSAPPGPAGNGQGTSVASARALAADLGSSPGNDTPVAEEVVSETDNTLVRLINTLIAEAAAQRASDIHIETQPAPLPVRIRLRIDGDLQHYLDIPTRWRYALVARLKIMANMDISEHRKPQDGKIDFSRYGNLKLEMRVVTVPTMHGLEDVVLRLLGATKPLPLEKIGLNPENLEALRQMARKTYGLILVCGPTGCGKTTTLHSLIRDINTEGRKIWTAEDPVEITQEGLRQVQVNPRIGWTFAAAMRTFLRADPDVIMIGEMRDEETARIAVEASLTGHLVLSTLHTNSAPESVGRLLEIGLDPFNFSDSLLAILAQRLVRRLCTQCRESHVATADELQTLAAQYLIAGNGPDTFNEADVAAQINRWRARHPGESLTLYRASAQGCKACEGHGYHGRLGLHELLLCNDRMRAQIRQRASGTEIRLSALKAGMQTLRQDGIDKVLQGLTDMAEVLTATNQ